MQMISDTALAAIGRMTVAATDLEYLLAWIGADRAGGDVDAVFARPGDALMAARGSAEFADAETRQELITVVESAGIYLALSQTAVRRLWCDDVTPDPAVFNEIAGRLLACRQWLQTYVEEHLGVTTDRT